MATSICPKCSKDHFELKDIPIEETRYPYKFVQCSACGCVVGVIDHYNIPFLLKQLGVKLPDEK